MKKLTVEVRHSDGRSEEVSLVDAILIYERRRDAAANEVEKLHCQRRIEELQARWKKALRGTKRAQTKSRTLRTDDERT